MSSCWGTVLVLWPGGEWLVLGAVRSPQHADGFAGATSAFREHNDGLQRGSPVIWDVVELSPFNSLATNSDYPKFTPAPFCPRVPRLHRPDTFHHRRPPVPPLRRRLQKPPQFDGIPSMLTIDMISACLLGFSYHRDVPFSTVAKILREGRYPSLLPSVERGLLRTSERDILSSLLAVGTNTLAVGMDTHGNVLAVVRRHLAPPGPSPTARRGPEGRVGTLVLQELVLQEVLASFPISHSSGSTRAGIAEGFKTRGDIGGRSHSLSTMLSSCARPRR